AETAFRPVLYRPGTQISAADVARVAEALEVPKDIIARLAQDEQRNLCIIMAVEELAKRHARILVFAASVDHSRLLTSVLRARQIRADSVTADTPSRERDRIITAFKEDSPDVRVLCNYGVLTTGFDAPRTSAAVIARPTKSLVLYSQMVGRVIRGVRAGGNKEAEIVTVVDSQLPGFGTVGEAFKNWEDVWEN